MATPRAGIPLQGALAWPCKLPRPLSSTAHAWLGPGRVIAKGRAPRPDCLRNRRMRPWVVLVGSARMPADWHVGQRPRTWRPGVPPA
eukprot:4994614-Lingulodinium_polyedra.AAC.1